MLDDTSAARQVRVDKLLDAIYDAAEGFVPKEGIGAEDEVYAFRASMCADIIAAAAIAVIGNGATVESAAAFFEACARDQAQTRGLDVAVPTHAGGRA